MRFNYMQMDAARIFKEWAAKHTPFSKPPTITNISTHYAPFWVFQATVHMPGFPSRRLLDAPTLAVYAGDKWPRKMTEVVKNPVTDARPFSADMLDAAPGVVVEPFHTYEATAWQLARAAHIGHERELYPHLTPEAITFDAVESHRVLMPLHIVEYKYLFETFRVFINASSGQAFGIQQQPVLGAGGVGKVLETLDLRTILAFVERFVPNPIVAQMLATSLLALSRPLMKVLLWPPFFVGATVAVGSYLAARATKSVRESRSTFAEWEETRLLERQAQATMTDEWVFRPLGRTQGDRARERKMEGEAASGASSSSRSSSSSSYTRQQQSTSSSSSSAGAAGAAGSGRAREAPPKPRPAAAAKQPPYVNPDDYYAVLGLQAMLQPRAVGSAATVGVTTRDVQEGFRRELMRYHPDHQQDDGYDFNACSERTRLIIKAYGVLRDAHKRAAYDASYRPGR